MQELLQENIKNFQKKSPRPSSYIDSLEIVENIMVYGAIHTRF